MAAEAQHAIGVDRIANKGMAAGVAMEVQQAATGIAETVNDADVVMVTNNEDIIVVATPARTTQLAPKKIIKDMVAMYGKQKHH